MRNPEVLKKPAVGELHLKRGSKVISFCCGTGQEFSFIQEKIGRKGRILGIDYSAGMLQKAKQKIENNNWNNIKLLEADVTDLPKDAYELHEYDAGLSTLGFSIISDPYKTFQSLRDSVKKGGRIVIGDIQALHGNKAWFNPLYAFFNAPYGNTYRSLIESRDFEKYLRAELHGFKKIEYLFGSYYIASGTTY